VLQAKVFEFSKTTIGDMPVTPEQITWAVEDFNGDDRRAVVVLGIDSASSQYTIDMERSAATIDLHLRDMDVFANIYLLDTVSGRIAKDLLASDLLRILPRTQIIVNTEKPKGNDIILRIHHFVFPMDPSFSNKTPLQKVKEWTQGYEYWPLFEVKEYKY